MHKTREAIDQQQVAEMIINQLNKIEHPILFNTEMIKAILEGHKTMTRRLLRSIEEDNFRQIERIWLEDGEWLAESKSGLIYKGFIKCPYGKKGDILWVRETFTELQKGEFKYKASIPNRLESGIWKPSIHMPKSAARIWLRIKNIRIERICNISYKDCIAEGIEKYGPFGEYKGAPHPGGMLFRAFKFPQSAFRSIWVYMNGEKSWKENPWVWVIEFEVLSTTGKPN